MTGSTSLDIDIESTEATSTDLPELSTNIFREQILPSNIPEFVGPPDVIKAELVSRNHLIVRFNAPIKGADVCHDHSNKTIQRNQPRQFNQVLGCCQQIFREPPFLNSYGMLLIY